MDKIKKYRVKLVSGRVIGPFILGQLEGLFEKKRIKGDEECQLFPDGDWRPIKEYSELSKFYEDLEKKDPDSGELVFETSGESFAASVADKEKKVKKINLVEKYRQKKAQERKSASDVEKIDKTIVARNGKFVFDLPAESATKDSQTSIVKEEDPSDKTIINVGLSNMQIEDEEEEFIAIPTKTVAELAAEKKDRHDEELKQVAQQKLKREADAQDAHTVFLNLEELERAKESDIDERVILEEQVAEARAEINNDDDEEEEENSSRKGMRPIILFAFIA
ncbi:unnamed protein product, partial [marine sediment metagenome]